MKNFLREQLEEERFLHGIAYVKKEALGLKKLNSTELAHLNHILTHNEDPWRTEEAEIQIPTGHIQHFNLISNPLNRDREIIGHGLDLSGNGEVAQAAFYVYAELVLNHLFKDANRRTAVLAALWICAAQNKELDAEKLLKIPLGNLRDKVELDSLLTKVKDLLG